MICTAFKAETTESSRLTFSHKKIAGAAHRRTERVSVTVEVCNHTADGKANRNEEVPDGFFQVTLVTLALEDAKRAEREPAVLQHHQGQQKHDPTDEEKEVADAPLELRAVHVRIECGTEKERS